MIDPQLIHERFDEQTLASIGDSLKLLHTLGIFTHQVDTNCIRIAMDFMAAEPEAMTRRILEVQQTNRQLLALHEVAGSFKEGLKDAQVES